MQQDTVRADLHEIFEDVMDLDDLTLEDTTTADDIEEWDSLSHVRLIVAIERHFKVKFSNSEIEGLKKFKDMVDLIVTKAA